MARKTRDRPGQPPKWESPEKLQEDIDKYYEHCLTNDRPLTIAGLGAYLGVSRQTIYNYSYNDEFFDIIKKARDKIMASLEETAIIKGNAGTIFVMKQYGYTDRQEVALDSTKEAVDAIKELGQALETE